MSLRKLFIFLCCTGFSAGVLAQQNVSERKDWGRFFEQQQAHGTLVILDQRKTGNAIEAFNAERASRRYSPASTFKIPHTLFALDAGVVKDEFQRFIWDGVPRTFPGHNQDQNLYSAMRNSTVWVYQQFAAEIGVDSAHRYLQRIDYGNAENRGSPGDYWIDGPLEISALEQIAFLQQLYRNTLPFTVEHQRLVKDLIIKQAGNDWILRGKTGWSGTVGWFVGWMERPEGAIFFALNIDTPERLDDLPKREAIVHAILHSLNAMPAQLHD